MSGISRQLSDICPTGAGSPKVTSGMRTQWLLNARVSATTDLTGKRVRLGRAPRYILLGLLAVLLALSLTVYKLHFANETGFDIDLIGQADIVLGYEAGYDEKTEMFVLLPDEKKYLTWLIFRSGNIAQEIEALLNFSLPNINVYGYLISGFYLLTLNWKPFLLLGTLYLLLFLHSTAFLCNRLLETNKARRFVFVLIVMAPQIIYLSSGLLRDLIIASLFNYLLVAVVRRRMAWAILLLLLLTSLRSAFPVIVAPVLLFLLFESSETRRPKGLMMATFGFITALSLVGFLPSEGDVTYGGPEKLIPRLVEVITGINQVVINFVDLFDASAPQTILEILSAVYHFFLTIAFWLLFIQQRALRRFGISIMMSGCILAILYALHLGFLIGRTKLTLTWLFIFYIGLAIDFRIRRSAK